MADPVTYDFTIYQGATFSKVIVWQTSAGVPIPLTGYKARMQVRNKIGPASLVLLELTTENGGIILEPDDEPGVIQLYATATQTSDINKDGIYDLELVDESDPGIVERLLQGRVSLSKQVTL